MFFGVSPQAIFKDPFRRGNNILVSVNLVRVLLDPSMVLKLLILNDLRWISVSSIEFQYYSWEK